MAFCTNCGNQIENGVKFCPVCGTPAAQQPVMQQSVMQQPVMQQPTAQEPMTEQPMTEQPMTGQPVMEEAAGMAGAGVSEPVIEEPVQEFVPEQGIPARERPGQSAGAGRQTGTKKNNGGGLPLPVIIIGAAAALIIVVVIAFNVIKHVIKAKSSTGSKGEGTALTELLDSTAATYYLGGGVTSSGDDAEDSAAQKDTDESSSGDVQSGGSDEIPDGDGMVSEEDLQKGYVWLDEVKNGVFDTTYEELADWFGVDGEFDKEDYSDTYSCKMRYYTWYSKDDNNHLIYVNLGERDPENKPGVYTITGFNSNGWNTTEAAEKYLDDVKAMASENDKAAAANAESEAGSIEVFPFGEKEGGVTVNYELPSGWSFNEKKKQLLDSDDPDAFGAGFMEFEAAEDTDWFDRYKDTFEDYKELDDREIGGVTMKGRSYKYVGYDWIRYIGELDDGRIISVAMVDLDPSDGTMTDRVLKSITFK